MPKTAIFHFASRSQLLDYIDRKSYLQIRPRCSVMLLFIPAYETKVVRFIINVAIAFTPLLSRVTLAG